MLTYQQTSPLFQSINMGDLHLKNRIIMAPLTRCRASEGRIPNQLMATYYAQRASAGLIITEGTIISENAGGYPNTPGIWNEEQVAGWKLITDAVHEKGGKIVVQLWHVGRVSDPVYSQGKAPVAPSAIAAKGQLALLYPKRDYPIPKALTIEEIKEIVEDFRKGAENAKEAGFDGVELHGANGYLLDQFLQDSSNHRTDEYGGSTENSARFPLEVVDAVASVFGPGRVGYHMAPSADGHSMGDSNLLNTFSYLTKELNKRKIAFIFAREPKGFHDLSIQLKPLFQGAFIINSHLTKEIAEEKITKGDADAAGFGTLFIQNPDLVERFYNNYPVTHLEIEKSSYYLGGEKGYIDYPNYKK